jgi:P27 family predicted phage terminase small subunit
MIGSLLPMTTRQMPRNPLRTQRSRRFGIRTACPLGRIPKPVGTTVGHHRPTGVTLPNPTDRRPVPRAPAGLLAVSRKRWRAYWLSTLAQAVDRLVDLPRIERWIEMSDEYEKVNAILKQTRLVKGSMGQPTLSPLAGYLSILLAELRAAETELGMTPLARQRLGIAYGQARLTLHELKRVLHEQRDQREREPWEDEWAEA